jgi:hypothetical protein
LLMQRRKETIYWKRKRGIWTKDWLKRSSVFGHGYLLKNLNSLHPLITRSISRCVHQHSVLHWNLLCPLYREVLPVWGKQYHRSMSHGTTAHTRSYMLQNVAQPDCCATKFKPVWKSSDCCTNSQTTPHTHSYSLHNSLCCANGLIMCGDIKSLTPFMSVIHQSSYHSTLYTLS